MTINENGIVALVLLCLFHEEKKRKPFNEILLRDSL